MEKLISVKKEYASLEKIEAFMKKETSFKIKQSYDSWEVHSDENGQPIKCVVVKKSNMHGVKIYFTKENTMKINHIIPNKLMYAYFGKSVKARQDIIEIVTGKIKEVILAGSQKKAFEEIAQHFNKISI